jgi:hypothetical protein
MSKRASAALFSFYLLAIAVLAACAKPVPEPPPLSKSEISGARLWERITKDTDYEKYPEWPGYGGMRIGQSPHGRYHEIYVNRTLLEALPIAAKTAPRGSIIVKENFDADRKSVGFTVMAKVEGYDPGTNDWFWAAYSPDGKINMEGSPAYCIKCHEGLRSNDYIIVRPLDAALQEARK